MIINNNSKDYYVRYVIEYIIFMIFNSIWKVVKNYIDKNKEYSINYKLLE